MAHAQQVQGQGSHRTAWSARQAEHPEANSDTFLPADESIDRDINAGVSQGVRYKNGLFNQANVCVLLI